MLVGLAAHDHIEAAAFVVRAAELDGLLRRAAAIEAEVVSSTEVRLPWRGGTLRAHAYHPADIDGRAILLLPGVHAAGIDEPRLVALARHLAAAGHPVIATELPDLADYRITSRTTDMIEDAARAVHAGWKARVPDREQQVGLIGISFAGGLAVVAASRLPDAAAWALSFGGHGDLPRTLRYLCTGELPDGSLRPPHDYGVVIILLDAAERMVPAAQVAPLREGIRAFLRASHLDMVDKPAAALAFAQARALAGELPEPARTLMTWVNERDVQRLGQALLPHLPGLASEAALSPERNHAPTMPIHLLHGADDNVVPATESEQLAIYLRRQGAEVTQLSTALITHAEVERAPSLMELWRLIRFWAGPL